MTSDFVEFVVQPYLELAGIEDAFLVGWKSDMLIAPRHPTRRTPPPKQGPGGGVPAPVVRGQPYCWDSPPAPRPTPHSVRMAFWGRQAD